MLFGAREVLQHVQRKSESVIEAPKLSGRRRPAPLRRQSSALREVWWPTHWPQASSASRPAGTHLSPQIGGRFTETGSALGFLWRVGSRSHVAQIGLTGRHNKVVKSFAAVTRTSGCAGRRLPQR